MHGGRAPQTIAAAKQRLLEGVEPAIARLLRFIEAPPGLCDVCGRSDDVGAIVTAIRTVLDRCGLHPSATLEVIAPQRSAIDDMTIDEMIEHTERTLVQMRGFRDAQLPESVDAVIVPEDEADPLADGSFPSGIGTLDKWTESK